MPAHDMPVEQDHRPPGGKTHADPLEEGAVIVVGHKTDFLALARKGNRKPPLRKRGTNLALADAGKGKHRVFQTAYGRQGKKIALVLGFVSPLMQRHAITGMLGKGNIVTGRQPVRAKLAGFIHPQTELHQRIAADARVGRFPVGVTLRERPDDLPEKRLLQIEDMQRHPQGTARSLKPRDGIVLRRGFFLEGMEGNHLSRIFTLQGRHRIQAVRPAAYGYGYGHKEILFREWRARHDSPQQGPSSHLLSPKTFTG